MASNSVMAREKVGNPLARFTLALNTTLKTALKTRPLILDALLYLGFLIYALVLAFTNEFYGFRVWGGFAAIGYGLALLHTFWLLLNSRRALASETQVAGRKRWIGISCIAIFAMAVPLIVLLIRRLTGRDWLNTPFSWSAQPEVWVIERSARLLLEHGTPYVDVLTLGRAPEVNDYTPYGPVMAIFGIPKALLGGTPLTDALTDARLMFLLTFGLCLVATLKLLNWPKIPILAAQLAIICPMTALTSAVAGPDLAMLGLLILAVALALRDHPVAAAIVLALVGSAKLIPLMAAPVLAALVFSLLGRQALLKFLLTLIGITAVLNVPIFLVNPDAFFEHVVRFPAGLGSVASPAASPLPGHLLAESGPLGKIIAFALLGIAGLAILIWLVRQPPRTGSDALGRITIGLAAFTLLTTATRYGYLIYPIVLVGALLCFKSAEGFKSAEKSTKELAGPQRLSNQGNLSTP